MEIRRVMWKSRGMSLFFSNTPVSIVGMLLLCLALSLNGCVIFDFPDDPLVMNPPYVGENAATITIVRKKQFASAGTTQSIMLDGAIIANLKVGQYTRFQVSEDRHSLGIAWRIGGVYIIGPTGGFSEDISDFYKKELTLDCVQGQNYYLTIEAKGFALHDADRMIFKRVQHLEGDFELEGKVFVPAGQSEILGQ